MKEFVVSKIELPNGFSASIEEGAVAIKGPKGELKKKLPSKALRVSKEGNAIVLEIASKKRKHFALMTSFEKHLENMIRGLEKGFEYQLRVVYAHFPINVSVKGSNVEISNFLGEKKNRVAKILPGATVEVKAKDVFVRGSDKEAVGQTAANIERKTKTKGKDRRVFQDGIFLVKSGARGA